MKFWLSCLGIAIAAGALALSAANEYLFFAGFVVLTFIVLATAWNILGGYAGYVNFGTSAFFGSGAYAAVVLFQALGAPLACADRRGALIGAAARLRRRHHDLRLRGIFFAIATVAWCSSWKR
jgi:branched-chain amino acid transport system permease protein